MACEQNIRHSPVGMESARAATAGIPADQALGLRLIAMARAAAAQHMAEVARLPEHALVRSQAAGLLSEVRS